MIGLLLSFVCAAAWASDAGFQRRVSEASQELAAAKRLPAALSMDRYSTDCGMDDYYGYGYVSNHSSQRTLEIDGSVYFYYFDKKGYRIGDARESAHKSVWRGRREEIQKHYYPKGTASCTFEVSEAARWEGGAPDPLPYATDCSLRSGKAYGYVYNQGSETLRISGQVTWYFYEDDGDLAGTENERINARVQKGDRDLVGEADAPRQAVSCFLDISGAVE